MAKPIKSELESLSLSDIDENHSFFSKKRPRHRLNEDSPDPLEVTDDGRPKTRRVNPARLAIRLGPELVSEMEAYIAPGAKMPNFTVRKDFQERYSVDRRHIYDYFHSRGLRVAKEDKHTNLTRGRANNVVSQAATPPVSFLSSSEGDIPGLAPPRIFIAPSKPSLPKQVQPRPPKKVTKKKATKLGTLALSAGVSIESKVVAIKPYSRFGETLPPSFSGEARSTSPVVVEKRDSPCPEFTLPCDLSDSATSEDMTFDFEASSPFEPEVYSLTGCEMLTNEFLPTYDSEVDRLMAVDEHRPLNQEERTGLYDLINGALPGSINIGESAGTYSAYMKAGSHRSIDRRLGTNRPTPFSHNLKSTRPGSTDFYANVPEIELEHVDVDCWVSTDVGYIAQEFDPAEFSQILVESSYVCPELHSEELEARSSLTIHEAPDTPQANQSNIQKQVQGSLVTMFSPERRRLRTSSARGEI